ncbi:multifunctional acyl-CoA thioesterase I/protease I/lysophospholipase L1 [Psychrobacter sp. AntiMn-1]|uniref:arylesterase n=1 Tax=Psychrobacter sp. AntiMn-1 TaxID=1720344 RepID=UPI0008A6CD0D|nr:arylesterase [Psychrobacter sp. AntiMn-1]AOY44244.1 multifunctional acyl-CoA thioesterase I/protease I/lysophospholipase L1 [Psychrobacter sp. AntiMn-1]
MLNTPSRLAQHLPAIAMLAAIMAISGCQKETEPTTPNQPTDTQRSDTETTANQANTTSVDTNADAPTDMQVNSSPITILALGDSLTEGLGVDKNDNYPAQLEDRLQAMGYKNTEVINSGLSGETSTGLVNRLDWVLQTKPDVTILTIGANDAIRGIDVATIEANIRTAVKRLQDNGSVVILGGMSIYDNLGDDYVAAFSDIYPRVAKDMSVPLIPFFLEGVGGEAELNQADAIHPTKEGYTIIVNDNILPILEPTLQEVTAAETSQADTTKNTTNEST